MRKILDIVLLIIGITIMYCVSAKGQELNDQNTSEEQLWLARAAISEVGWPSNNRIKTEHAAVWHSLSNRWKQYTGNSGKSISFVNFIRRYCSGLGKNEFRKGRQKWIVDLNFQGKKPKNWPKKLAWYKYIKLWFNTLQNADLFLQGKIKNPCPGASHFGNIAVGDEPKGNMVLHSCNYRFGNQFYKVVK